MRNLESPEGRAQAHTLRAESLGSPLVTKPAARVYPRSAHGPFDRVIGGRHDIWRAQWCAQRVLRRKCL